MLAVDAHVLQCVGVVDDLVAGGDAVGHEAVDLERLGRGGAVDEGGVVVAGAGVGEERALARLPICTK